MTPYLPRPQSTRWQPTRGGLLNMYRFDQAEFLYEKGRLLLRGNNGTGKSRILALQLPFLLDGEVIANRVEPDRNLAKRMEWNLLLGEYEERTGYSWMEFGRLSPEGEARFCTVGIGLTARKGVGIAKRWYFVTSKRIGSDLALKAEAGYALPRDALIDAIGAEGEVYEKAASYRTAVNRALFGLEQARYEALLNLLIQLRQPQLSRDLNEDALSSALTEALAPLENRVLQDLADAFGNLESERTELARFHDALQATDRFLGIYRTYVQTAFRRGAEGVRTAGYQFETAQKKLREAERRFEEAKSSETRLLSESKQTQEQIQTLDAALEALMEAPLMKAANELDNLRQLAEASQKQVERARQAAQEAGERADRFRQHWEALQDKLAAADRETATQRGLAAQDLEKAGFNRLTDKLPDSAAHRSAEALTALRKLSREEVAARERALSMLQAQNEELRRAGEAKQRCEERLGEAEERHREALAAQAAAESARSKAVELYLDSYRLWARGLREMQVPAADVLEDALGEWALEPAGDNPLTHATRAAHLARQQALAAEQAATQTKLAAEQQRTQELEAEIASLRERKELPPPPPHTRKHDRAGTPGAPLWRLIDFVEGIEAKTAAGIEAALEAAGLLDAWVMPDGKVLDAALQDTLFDVSAAQRFPPAEPALTRYLTYETATDIPAAVIRTILEAIGCEPHSATAWVSPDGRWGLGPLAGSYTKEAPAYIGATARENARQARLTELAQLLQAQKDFETALADELRTIDASLARLGQEYADRPTDDTIRQAHARLAATAPLVQRSRADVEQAQKLTTEAEHKWKATGDQRHAFAADAGLLAWLDNVAGGFQALRDAERSLTGFLACVERGLDLATQTQSAAHEAIKAAEDREALGANHADATRELNEANTKYATLKDAVGGDVALLQTDLATKRKLRKEANGERERIQDALMKASANKAAAEASVASTEVQLQSADQGRTLAAARFIDLWQTGLAPLADATFTAEIKPGAAFTPVLESARAVETALANVPAADADWDRIQGKLWGPIQELTANLGTQGYEAVQESRGGIHVLQIRYGSDLLSMHGYRTALVDEAARRQQLLSAGEKTVLENHLVGEIAAGLHDRLHRAERWVNEVNVMLEQVPMSTGMKLRFAWRPDPEAPPELGAVLATLKRSSALWSPADREAVGAFLQRQIGDARETDQAGSWFEHLTAALDYRKWFRFGVERHQDGRWVRLTKRTHGTGSGGERAVALTLPQFAAAASFYASAGEAAPRLILLDEAFAGIDRDMRAKCLGFLAHFDLDLVMTSENEWACYKTLPGIAIYNLVAPQGAKTVHYTRWVWNGRERIRDEAPAAGAPPAEPTPA